MAEAGLDLSLTGAGTGLDHCQVLALDSEALWDAVRSPDIGDRIAAARSVALTEEQLVVLADPSQPFAVRRAVASRADSAAIALARQDRDPVVRATALAGASSAALRRLLGSDPQVARYLRVACA